MNTIYELVPELREQPRGSLRSARFPFLKRVCFLGPEKHRGMYSMHEVMELACQVSDEEYLARQAGLTCHDVVNMQYTSGTTGFPKGVQLTHYNIGNNGYWIGANQNLGPIDKVCLPVPLFHCFGCVLGVMACVNHGSAMVFVEMYDPVKVMTSVETGALHRGLRRAHHVHRHAGTPALQQSSTSPRCAPASWPARPAR